MRNPDLDRAALEALAGIVYDWSRGIRPATDMLAWAAAHPDTRDRGITEAWTDPAPLVAGKDYLPVGDDPVLARAWPGQQRTPPPDDEPWPYVDDLNWDWLDRPGVAA